MRRIVIYKSFIAIFLCLALNTPPAATAQENINANLALLLNPEFKIQKSLVINGQRLLVLASPTSQTEKIFLKKIKQYPAKPIKTNETKLRHIYLLPLRIGAGIDWLAPILQAIHITTQASFLGTQLELAGLTSLDSSIAANAERHLRQLKIFTHISFHFLPIADNSSQGDLLIVIRDAFSLYGSINGGSEGGRRWLELETGDYNFLVAAG